MPIDIPYSSGFGLAGWDWQAQRNKDLEERNRATAKFPLEQERRRFELDRDKELFDTGRPERTFANLMGQHKVQNIDQYKKLQENELTNALSTIATNLGDNKLQQGMQRIAMFADAINPKSMSNQNLAQNPARIAEIEKMAKEFNVDLSAFGTPGSKQWTERATQLVNEAKTMIFNLGIGQSKNFQGASTQEAIKAQESASRNLANDAAFNQRLAAGEERVFKEKSAERAFEMEKELIRLRGQIQKEVANLQKDGKQNLRERLAEAQLKGDRDTARAIATALFIGETGDASLQFNDQGKIIGFQPTDKLKDVLKTIDIMMGASPSSEAPKGKTSQGPEPTSRPTVSPAYKKAYDEMVGRGWVEGQQFFVHPDGSVTVNENNSVVQADQKFGNRGTTRKPQLGTESQYTDSAAPFKIKGSSTQGGAALIPQSSGRR